MPVINPVSPYDVAQGRTAVSVMGAVPAPLGALVTGNPYWYDAAGNVLIFQDATDQANAFLDFIDLDTNTVTLADASGQNNLGAGNSVWAAELSGISVRTNVGGLGPFLGSALAEVSEDGSTCIIVRQSTGSGLAVYDSAGASVYSSNVALTNPNVHLRRGILSYQDVTGWHLVDTATGAFVSTFQPRPNITNLIPFLLGSTVSVLEYETPTGLWSIRAASSLTGLTINPGTDSFRADILGTGASAARMAWSTGQGELASELVILDIDTATGTTSLGTVSGGTVVFATGPTLDGTTFAGATSGGNLLPYQSQPLVNRDGTITKPWRDALQKITSGVQTVTTTVNNLPPPSTGAAFSTIGTVVAGGPSSTLILSSSDSSITITPTQSTSSIDLTAAGGGTVTHTGALTANEVVIGNGGADIKVLGTLGTTTTVLHGNAAGAPTFAAVSLTADVTGDLPFANLVPASGASKIVGRGSAAGAGDFQELTLGAGLALTGTVLDTTGSGTVTNTGTLTDHALIVGNGGVDVSALASLGTTTTVLHGNAAGDPTFGSVDLAADITGDLPFSNLTPASAANILLGRGSAAGAGDYQEITLGTGVTLTGTVLSATGTGGTVTTTGSPASGELTKFSGASTITNGDLSGDVTTSGALATTISNAAVTLAKIANAAASSKLLGSGASGAGASYAELTLGTNLTMSGTTLNASGGSDLTNAGNPQGVVSASPGQTCRDTTNGVLYIKEGGGSTAYGWYRAQWSPYEGNIWYVAANPISSASVTNMGIGSATVSNGNGGTSGSLGGRNASGMCMGLTSGTTTATGASVVNNTGDIGGSANVDAVFLIQTDPSDVSAHTRYMIGFFNSNTPQNTDSLGLAGAICFRYSTTAGDGGWVGVTENNFAAQSVTATVASIAANTVYKLRIRYFASGTVYFSVNDGTEVSTSTGVPTPANANLSVQVVISNPDGGGAGGTGRQIGFYRHWGWNGIGS